MENQEFVIKGTVDEMIKVLNKDFDMSKDEAKYFVYIMINQHSKDVVNTINKDELDIWYLSEEDKYTGKIFNTHLSISFTSVEKKLQHTAYIFFVKYVFSRDIDLVLIGADLVYAVVSAISKIADTDYCVFSRIIELCVGNKERIFSMNDIQVKSKDGKCDYQEEDWKCTYIGQDENCTCNAEKVKLSFSQLEKKNIIKKVGNRWMLVK